MNTVLASTPGLPMDAVGLLVTGLGLLLTVVWIALLFR